MADIIEEVLQDQSDEKKLRYFKKFAFYLISMTLFIAAFMLVYGWYSDKRKAQNIQLSSDLLKMYNLVAEQQNDNKELVLQSLVVLSKQNNSRVSEIASLQIVGLQISDKDYVGAKETLQQIIANTSYSNNTTAYARIAWLALVLDVTNISDVDKAKAQQYLQYFDNERKVFFGSATILKALWYIKNDELHNAKQALITVLALKNIPLIMQEQAKALLSQLEREGL